MEEWKTEAFGASHTGVVGVLLADGSEPGPVYFDVGSGGSVHCTTSWSAYDGKGGRPEAVALRAACSCGWRGTSRCPIDWSVLDDDPLCEPDIDTEAPRSDWRRHIADVDARTMPLPVELQDLLEKLGDRLGKLAFESPLAALKAVAALERTTRRAGQDAAYEVTADEDLSWARVATALGLTEDAARSRLNRYTRDF